MDTNAAANASNRQGGSILSLEYEGRKEGRGRKGSEVSKVTEE
jgi:hypothetical protein